MARAAPLPVVLVLAAALAGCQQAPKRLYDWDGFQEQLYHHFRGDVSGSEEQLRALLAHAESARASGTALPPGFRAHLGLLYLDLGRDAQARQALEAEKAAFPESAPFMDFLLRRMTVPKS